MKKKHSLIPVFIVVLTDLIGFGIVLPLLPYYGKTFGASAVLVGLLYSVYSFAQLIFSPMWGSYSDRVGRRPIMIISTLGAVVAYIIFGLANSLLVLFLSRIFAGIMGGNVSTAYAYVTDITTKENRSKGMGMMGAAFGIGFLIGPAIAGGLISHAFHQFITNLGFPVVGRWMEIHKYAIPGFFAALLSFCSSMLVIFKLSETVDTSARKKAISNPMRNSVFSRSFWKKLSNQTGSDTRGLLFPLLIACFFLAFGQSSLYSAFPLFSKANLDLNIVQISMLFVYIGLIAVIIQGGVMRQLTKYVKEEYLFLIGCILMAVGLGLIPLAGSMEMLAVYLGIMAVGFSLNNPTMLSLVSQEAGEDNAGAIMGTSTGIRGLGRVIGPVWGGFLFGISDGLPFYVTAIVFAVTIYIGYILVKGSSSKEQAKANTPFSPTQEKHEIKQSPS